MLIEGDSQGLREAARSGGIAVQQLVEKVTGVDRAFKSAGDSANVFFEKEIKESTAAVNQLRVGIDPLYASTMRLEQGQSTLNSALELGTIDMNRYRQMNDLLEQQHRQTVVAIEAQTVATGRLSTMTRGGAGGIQNFSYQLQDIFTQVGMGVPLLISLGQQAPQILSGFGQVGAIAGVVAAGLFPLIAVTTGLGYAKKKTGEEAETMADKITGALDLISSAQSLMTRGNIENLNQLTKKYGEVTEGVLLLLEAQQKQATETALGEAKGLVETVFKGESDEDLMGALRLREQMIKQTQDLISQLEIELPLSVSPRAVEAKIDQLKRILKGVENSDGLAIQFDIDPAQLQQLADLRAQIAESFETEDLERSVELVSEFRQVLATIPSGALKETREGLIDAEDLLRQALNLTNLTADEHERLKELMKRTAENGAVLPGVLSHSREQAAGIADELGRALANMQSLSLQGISSLEESQLRLDFRGDEVGLAGALAEREMLAKQSALRADATTLEIAHLDGLVHAHVRNAEATARNREELAAWQRQQNKSAGSAGKSAKSIDRVARELDKLAPSYERDVAAAERWRDLSLASLDKGAAGYDDFVATVEEVFQQRLAQAYRDDLDRRTDWEAGILRGLDDINDGLMSWADVGENLVTNWSSGLEDAFVNLSRTGKLEVGDLVDYTIEQFQRLAYQQAIQPGLDSIFDWIAGGVGSLFGGAGTTTTANSHTGSIVGTGSVSRTYQSGLFGPKIANDERLAVLKAGQRVFTPRMIENGSAVVDALAAAAARPAAGSGSVLLNINVINENGSKVEESVGPDGTPQIRIMDQVEGEMARRVRSGKGSLAAAIGSTYKVGRSFQGSA